MDDVSVAIARLKVFGPLIVDWVSEPPGAPIS